MKSSPGLTQQAIGMSGCQRLWICSFSVAAWLRSTLMRVSVMTKLLGRLSIGDMPLEPVLMHLHVREIRRMTYAPGLQPCGLAAFGGAPKGRHRERYQPQKHPGPSGSEVGTF